MNASRQCREIYQEAFGINEPFDSMLFDGFFDCCRYLTENGAVASMLFSLPCTLETSGESLPARYIYAAATAAADRSKGYMTRLLGELCKTSQEVLLLKPADEGLIGYYRRFGFLPFRALRDNSGIPCIRVSGELKSLAGPVTCDGAEFTMMYRYKKALPLDGLAFLYAME